MDETELARRASRLPARYETRLDPTTYSDINRSVRVGEWGEALEQLVAALQQTNTPVTSEERAELTELLTTVHRPTERLDALTIED